MKPTTKKSNTPKIKLSPRSKAVLTPEEMSVLKNYTTVLDPDAALSIITTNTGVRTTTINSLFTRGWCELSVAQKLQKFLKELVETDYYKNLLEIRN